MAETQFCASCGTLLADGERVRGSCPRCLMRMALDDVPLDEQVEDPLREAISAELTQYEFLSVLGRGGMGTVYQVRQKSLNRMVALKVLSPSLGSQPGFAERFQREAQALAALAHPGIVQVFDFGKAGDCYYLAMEFVAGGSLRDEVRAGRLPAERAIEVIASVSEALQFAHDRGVVHRDIKPENLLVAEDGQVKIADFGLAKLVQADVIPVTLTRSDQVMGTVHYMAPEQFERPKEVDHRADIYSLGVVFYELLTGELPLGRFTPPSRLAGTESWLDRVVEKALEKNLAERYQSVGEIAGVLRGPRAPERKPTGRPEPVSEAEFFAAVERRRRQGRRFALAMVSILMVPVVLIALLPDGCERPSTPSSSRADLRDLKNRIYDLGTPIVLVETGLRLHPAAREVLGLETEMRQNLESTLNANLTNYRTALQRNAKVEKSPEEDSVRVEFTAFPAELEKLQKELEQSIYYVPLEAVSELHDMQLTAGMFPLGFTSGSLDIRRDRDGFRWKVFNAKGDELTAGGGRPSGAVSGEKTPWHIEEFWRQGQDISGMRRTLRDVEARWNAEWRREDEVYGSPGTLSFASIVGLLVGLIVVVGVLWLIRRLLRSGSGGLPHGRHGD